MTPLNFAIVGLRLIGIYFVIGSGPLFVTGALLMVFVGQISASMKIPSTGILLSSLIPAGSMVLLGLLLLVFAVPLARRLTPPISDQSKPQAFSLADIEAIAFAMVGILILASAFPDIGRAWQNFYLWFNSQSNDEATVGRAMQGLFYAIGICAQIIIGLFLILNAQGFRNAWRKLRTAGTRPNVE